MKWSPPTGVYRRSSPGKTDGKTRAFVLIALYLHIGFVRLENGVRGRKTQADTIFFQCKEGIEKFGQVLFGNALSIIGDGNIIPVVAGIDQYGQVAIVVFHS